MRTTAPLNLSSLNVADRRLVEHSPFAANMYRVHGFVMDEDQADTIARSHGTTLSDVCLEEGIRRVADVNEDGVLVLRVRTLDFIRALGY